MDVGEIRNLVRRPPSRGARIGIAAGLFVAVTIIWSARQSRLTREALDRAAAAEQAATQASADAEQARAQLRGAGRAPMDPAIRRTRHDDPREIERVKQLYEEIDGLTQFQEQVDQSLRTERFYVPKARAAPR
jgi:uncharacterized iron-regulated membrane protein